MKVYQFLSWKPHLSWEGSLNIDLGLQLYTRVKRSTAFGDFGQTFAPLDIPHGRHLTSLHQLPSQRNSLSLRHWLPEINSINSNVLTIFLNFPQEIILGLRPLLATNCYFPYQLYKKCKQIFPKKQ